MNIEVRYLNEKEIFKARKLYEEVFNDSKELIDYFFEEGIKSCRVLGGFFFDELICMMFLNEKFLCYNEKIIKGCYIYAVATDEKYRKKGYMGTLMKRVIKDRAESEFIFLIPVNEKIYEKHGFELIKQATDYKINEMNDILGYRIQCDFEIEDLVKFTDSIKENDTLNFLYNSDYFNKRIKLAKAEGGNIYLIIDEDKSIKAIIITGRNNGEECINNIVCENDKEHFYADIYYSIESKKKKINNKFINHPIMSYKGEFRGKVIKLNEEV